MNDQRAIIKQAACDDPVETGLIPVDIAFERLRQGIEPIQDQQIVALREALNRVLAEDIVSSVDVPAYVNSAMDGYAINSADIPTQGIRHLKVIDTAWAGKPTAKTVARGQCVRIMTGAMMPRGTDTVVIQEHVYSYLSSDGSNVEAIDIDQHVEAMRNVRQAGEDIGRGERILASGTWLEPAQLGVLASLGIAQVSVWRKPIVAFFTTGDELHSLDKSSSPTLAPSQIFDSNRYTLFGMLTRMGVDVIDLGVVPDSPDATRQILTEATQRADMVLSSGGVSTGAADFISHSLRELGDLGFWKLAIRPGRPLAYGRLNGSHFFGLPGNPVAVMVTFYEFVQPAIRRLMGCETLFTPTIKVACQNDLRKVAGRVEYQRGIYELNDGVMSVRTTGKQGAGRLTSMHRANCMIVLAAEMSTIRAGTLVDVQLFHGMV